jgi:hypothetical protein
MQQVAVGVVDLDGVEPEPCGAAGRSGECVADPGEAVVVQGQWRMVAGLERESGGIWAPPRQGRSEDALRPAWASWMAIGMSDQPRTASRVRRIAASVSSE